MWGSSKRQRNRFRVTPLVALALLFVSVPSAADPADPPPKTEASDEQPETTAATAPSEARPKADPATFEAAKKNAETLYKAGRDAWKKGQWADALLQYEASMRAFPSWTARTAAAACLVKLQRYDEALDAFESALREFGDKLPEKTKAATLEQVDIIRRETGSFMITGAAPGALVFVDGRWRGDHPLSAPVPTLAGQHWVKVYKEGFVVYEKDVTIPKAGGQTLEVTLAALPNAGRLKVGEVGRRKMEVVVDGVPVGVTPWDGPVSPGPHSVALRPVTAKPGPRGDTCDVDEAPSIPGDAGDPTSHEMGTEPMTVQVKVGQTTPIELKAERLGSVVRIVPDPPDAAVYIDGVFVGRGPYIGRAKPGRHVVKTQSEGYFPVTQEIEAKIGGEAAPHLELKKDVNAPKWAVAGRVLLEVRGGVPLAPSLGGVLDGACQNGCQQSLGVGANATFRAGYEFPNGLGFGGMLGYFQVAQSHVGFDASLAIDNVNVPAQGTANDSTLLRNFMVGAYGAYRLSNRFPLRFGLGAGLMYGNVTYTREGTFGGNAVGPLRQTGSFPWIYIEPEARIGVRISEGWSSGVAISGLVLVAPNVPVWTNAMQVNAHSDNPDQLGTFNPEAITGSVVFAMNLGVYVQYGF